MDFKKEKLFLLSPERISTWKDLQQEIDCPAFVVVRSAVDYVDREWLCRMMTTARRIRSGADFAIVQRKAKNKKKKHFFLASFIVSKRV